MGSLNGDHIVIGTKALERWGNFVESHGGHAPWLCLKVSAACVLILKLLGNQSSA